MVNVKKYHLPPTELMPNSPHPLLHYPGLLSEQVNSNIERDKQDGQCSPLNVYDLFASNGWKTKWIFRYGQTQSAHYHSRVHECMAVLSGEATIRFGVADTSEDLDESTHGNGREQGGIEVHAKKGDVFVLPAGLAHKTFDTLPRAEFALLTPEDGHQVGSRESDATSGESRMREALKGLWLDGFTMIGAYPADGNEWDFAKAGDSRGEYDKVWAVPRPSRDPVLGVAEDGLCGLWK